MKKLTVEHFLQAHEMMAGYYGTQAPDLKGVALAFKALLATAPWITQEQFDWALERAVGRCKFHPRVPDFLEELYERDCSALPDMPDIDPRYADEYQLGVYHRAAAQRDKLLERAGFNGELFRRDHLGQIPGTLPGYDDDGTLIIDARNHPRAVAGWDSERALDAGGPGQTQSWLLDALGG